MSETISMRQCADLLGVSVTTAAEYRQLGKFRAVKEDNPDRGYLAPWRIDKASFEAYLFDRINKYQEQIVRLETAAKELHKLAEE